MIFAKGSWQINSLNVFFVRSINIDFRGTKISFTELKVCSLYTSLQLFHLLHIKYVVSKSSLRPSSCLLMALQC